MPAHFPLIINLLFWHCLFEHVGPMEMERALSIRSEPPAVIQLLIVD